MANLKAILDAASLGMSNVVKTTVFLVDMADFSEMNEIYAKAFGNHKPARSTVAVAGLPRGVRVEIEVIASVSS
jgi:2-iminobutanoate/2-iminopropanoate deaminase